MKKIICFAAALALLLAGLGEVRAYAVSQAQIDAIEEQKKALSAERADMQADIDRLREEQAAVLEQKAALDRRNELAMQEIELINEQTELYSRLIDEKAGEVDEARRREEEQFSRYKAHVRDMEEKGKLSYLSILFSSRSLAELLSNLDLIGEMMSADKRLYEGYTAAREDTERVKTEYEAALTELTGRQAELRAEKAALEERLAEAARLITDLESDVEAYSAAFEENEAAEAALGAEIAALTAELKAKEEAERRAAEAAKEPYTGVGSAATGSYLWPCPSCTTKGDGYGMRWHPIRKCESMHYGLDIPAASGAEIVASDSGTVQLAAESNSYGKYVVIYHRDGVTTLYAHMSSMAVSAGDSVSAGQVIGAVGQTGWATGPHLHFEVAVDGVRVDPLGYI